LALTEIHKVTEALDKEKGESIDEDYLKDWSDLYSTLTREETNALFYSLREKVLAPGEVLLKQGVENDALFFIDDGELNLVFQKNGEEHTIKSLEPGEVVGEDSFFEASVSTTGAVAVTESVVNYLETKRLSLWEEEFPALESKLKDFCLKLKKIPDILEEKQLDRRVNKRFAMKGKVSFQMLDDSSKPEGLIYYGKLIDVSSGGLSVETKVPREVVPTFLSRTIKMNCKIQSGKANKKIDLSGVVVCIRYAYENNYSMHVKFGKSSREIFVKALKKSG
jgi:hypothetical protein